MGSNLTTVPGLKASEFGNFDQVLIFYLKTTNQIKFDIVVFKKCLLVLNAKGPREAKNKSLFILKPVEFVDESVQLL